MVKRGGWTHFHLHKPEKKPWEFIVVSALDPAWRVCEYAVLSPYRYAEKLHGLGCAREYVVALEKNDMSEPILVFAARKGFIEFATVQLGKLHKVLEVPYTGQRPTRYEDLLRAMVRFALPKSPQAEIDGIVEKRMTKRDGHPSVLLEEDNAELLEHVLEEDDAGDCKAFVDKTKENIKLTKAKAAAKSAVDKPEAKKAAGGGKKKGEAAAEIVPRKKLPMLNPALPCYTMEEATTLAPSAASMSVETTWHTRWRVEYGGLRFSRCFGGRVTEKTAFLACLTWAWNQAEILEGIACPWDLEADA